MLSITEYRQNGGYVDFVNLTRRHMSDRGLSQQEMGNRLDLSRSTIAQYLLGSYTNPESVEDKLAAYFDEQGVVIEESTRTIRPGEEFFQSADVRRIMALCSACQEDHKMGVIAGKSGYGKTHALLTYAQLPKVAYIECDVTMAPGDLVTALGRALGMNPGSGTSFQRSEKIKEYLLKNPGYLLIVDEADKLISKSSHNKMEIMRKFVKDSRINREKPDVGIVFAGEPQLIPLLKNYDERMDNRGTCWYELKGLAKKEAQAYLSQISMDDDVRDVLVKRACESRRGCFRRLDQTLDNIVRLLKSRDEARVSMKILEEASDMMLL